MQIPNYWLERPGVDINDDLKLAFDQHLQTTLALGENPVIPYNLPAPKWQFLCYLADHHDIALHGSGNPEIAQFEPRQSNDLDPFGNRQAVYAAADGLWAMFFAITDRDRYDMTIINSAIRIVGPDGTISRPFYFFSVSRPALERQPWRTGTVYLLPRATFEGQPPIPFGSSQVHIPQLASLTFVKPLARLTVAPSDFPFLSQIRGHDTPRLQQYATAMQTGAPWPDEG